MSEDSESQPPSGADIQARLHDVAQLLRQTGPIEPQAQRALAELVDELSKALAATTVPAAEVADLAASTAHLAESLHLQHDRGLLSKARLRLERAVSNAEAHAPVTVGLARRLLDALANLGI